LLGLEALARYIADEAHDGYLSQCLKTNAKPIKLTGHQILRRVQIVEAGDANYMVGEQVERSELLDENDRVNAVGKIPATYENVLVGITKASLSTDSFISAASFQEITRVLTEATIIGKRDGLRGLKENVIVGRLIPGGTGLAFHRAKKQKEVWAAEERYLTIPRPAVPGCVVYLAASR
jgi:DNA-directed RNA polymerase subunit beta'